MTAMIDYFGTQFNTRFRNYARIAGHSRLIARNQRRSQPCGNGKFASNIMSINELRNSLSTPGTSVYVEIGLALATNRAPP
jgi:hypothetical protein